MKKLFVTDLDGTFINQNESVSIINKKEVECALDEGHFFCIATGRSWFEVESIYEELNLNVPIACSNGLHIKFPHDDTFNEIKYLIDNDLVNKLLEDKYLKNNITGYFIKSLSKSIFWNEKNIFVNPHNYNKPHQIMKDNLNVNTSDLEITCITVSTTKEVMLSDIKKILEDKYNDYYINEYNGNDFNVFDISKSINKSDAIKHFADHYNLTVNDVVSFGDEWNDKEMLEISGLGIAVKNATKEIKKIADKTSEWKYNESAVGNEIKLILKEVE